MSSDKEARLHQIDDGTVGALSAEQREGLEEKIVARLKTVFDPEIPVDIYELGLIYNLDIQANGEVVVEMTLTSPACPVAGSLPGEVERKVAETEGVSGASVELVWDPPWDMEMMSEEARLDLGFM